MKSANLLHKCGLGDSDMNSTVTDLSCKFEIKSSYLKGTFENMPLFAK